MFNIASFLEKVSKNIKSKDVFNKQFLDIIKKHTGMDIPIENIETKDSVIILKISPGARNKVFIYKESILKDVNLLTKIVNIK